MLSKLDCWRLWLLRKQIRASVVPGAYEGAIFTEPKQRGITYISTNIKEYLMF